MTAEPTAGRTPRGGASIGRRAGYLIVVCGCVAAVFALVHVAREREAVYQYDTTQDVNYDFGRTHASRIVGRLQSGQIIVPRKQRPRDTVLLGIRVRSTLLGRWFEPRVEIEAGGEKLTQAFERGGSGLRYLNLGPLTLSRDTSIRLQGKYLEIGDQSVSLYYLPNDLDLDHGTILVISPHPDDAEIASFGLYAGRDAYVVTLTAGEFGGAGLFSVFDGANAYLEKGRTRVWNSLVVPMLGGLSPERTANLGYFDGTFAAMNSNPGMAVHSIESTADTLDVFRRTRSADLILPGPGRSATWPNLVQDLEYLVQHLKPDIIVTPYPLLDEHPDHKLSTVALIQALKNLNWTQGSLLLYTNHLPSSPIYPYGDAGDLVSLPPGIGGAVFDGIVSHSLTHEEQGRKYIALDAMIDLRSELPPDLLSSAARVFKHSLDLAINGGDVSFRRRAVRANELFFEVSVRSLYEPGFVERLEGDLSAGRGWQPPDSR